MALSKQEPTVVAFGAEALDRMFLAAEKVREVLHRSTQALKAAGIRHAICGSNATSAWIASVDESGVRQARNVELLLQRSDVAQALSVLAKAGFSQRAVNGRMYFYDFEPFKQRWANELTFADEPSWGRFTGFNAPSIEDIEELNGIMVVKLHALVRLQLGRYRLDDAVDVRDMMDVGLIDDSWLPRFSDELAVRLKHLLDTPDG